MELGIEESLIEPLVIFTIHTHLEFTRLGKEDRDGKPTQQGVFTTAIMLTGRLNGMAGTGKSDDG